MSLATARIAANILMVGALAFSVQGCRTSSATQGIEMNAPDRERELCEISLSIRRPMRGAWWLRLGRDGGVYEQQGPDRQLVLSKQQWEMAYRALDPKDLVDFWTMDTAYGRNIIDFNPRVLTLVYAGGSKEVRLLHTGKPYAPSSAREAADIARFTRLWLTTLKIAEPQMYAEEAAVLQDLL